MAIKGIHHIAMKCDGVAEYEKTVTFYKSILGLSVARSWGEGEMSGIMLDTGAGLLEIFAKTDHVTKQNGIVRHFAFAVDNTDEIAKRVRNAGYEITIEPTDIVIKSNPPCPVRVAFCIGPLGEEIEFFEER